MSHDDHEIDRRNLNKIDEGIKIVYNVLLLAILAILSWSVMETNETSKKIIDLQGKVDLTNVHLEYVRESISNLPKREEVDNLKTRVEGLDRRVTALEGWVAVEKRTIAPTTNK